MPCTATGASWVINHIYIAAEGFADELAVELGDALPLGEGLFEARARDQVAWAHNVWLEPRVIDIDSVADAARKLRALGRNWTLHPLNSIRRARLIESKLPPLKGKVLTFPEPPPTAPIGAWTLLDDRRMLVSPTTASPFPHGTPRFLEDKEGPPSRAYLKLWEALTRLGDHPRPGERCVDLGSSPGGWTWVCARLGASVVSVDKAPLDPRVEAMPGVETLQQSAFSLEPTPVDWLLCDVICYPPRLLTLVRRWLDQGAARRFVCTLKFQGKTDHECARAFASIPGSRVEHLAHNKHELTWML